MGRLHQRIRYLTTLLRETWAALPSRFVPRFGDYDEEKLSYLVPIIEDALKGKDHSSLAYECKHPADRVTADVHQADQPGVAVQWCRMCGAYRVNQNPHGTPCRSAWTVPYLVSMAMLPCSLHELEKAAIEGTLSRLGGNKHRAADELGIARSALYAKMRRHGLLPPSKPAVAQPPSVSPDP